MNYISRHMERKFLRLSGFFKVMLITGARQVGKTTMLRHLSKDEKRTYVTLDNKLARELAQNDPVLFFQTYKPPILIDEVQYAPELFEQIKILCDESEEAGQFWLTGSQQYNMMKRIRETLAGRVGILTLYGLSQTEKMNVVFDEVLDFNLTNLQERQKKIPKNDITVIFEHIWRGGYPQILHADAEQRQEYYNSYINTFLMRDVVEAGGVTDSLRFGKFLTACAALVSQQVNYKTLAETADISQPTAKEWLNLLTGLGIAYLLQPYANNALKRLSKTPKLYFCDTGLAAHLSMWLSIETLMNGAASGHFFKNYVIAELLKNDSVSATAINMTYFRDANAKEIDVFIESDHSIHPLKIKKSANPNRREVKKFEVLDKAMIQTGTGGIICMCEEPIPIDHKNCFIPCNLI